MTSEIPLGIQGEGIVMKAIVKNRALALDKGFLQAGFDEALSIYGSVLHRQGVLPSDIEAEVSKIKSDIAIRNGKLLFIQNVSALADELGIYRQAEQKNNGSQNYEAVMEPGRDYTIR